MKNINCFSLFQQVGFYVKGTNLYIDEEKLSKACDEFEHFITKLVKKEEYHLLDLFRYLNRANALITHLIKRIHLDVNEKNPMVLILEKAQMIVNSELEIVRLLIEHNGIDNHSKSGTVPALPLEPGVSQTDLVELITSFHLLCGSMTSDKRRADFKYVTGKFGEFFGIEIKNPEQIKHSILNRKINVTSFLDRLRSVLIEASTR